MRSKNAYLDLKYVDVNAMWEDVKLLSRSISGSFLKLKIIVKQAT